MLRAVGSLWLGAVLLVLLLVGMACATVYESQQGSERALVEFYTSGWFKALLSLIAVNALLSVIIRFPFSKRQIGFVITHAGILVTLGGACVTGEFGVEGRIGFVEGETVDTFSADADTLTVANPREQTRASVNLVARAYRGFREVEPPPAPPLILGDLRIEIERFLPDSAWVERILDDYAGLQPAVEVSLSPSGEDDPVWLFPGETDTVGEVEATLRMAANQDELERLLAAAPPARSGSRGFLRIESDGSVFEVPLEQALDQAVPLGNGATTVRVLRYLPHALVGEGRQLVNASDRPVNPAVEVELAGPGGTEKRYAFSKFPDLSFMHGQSPTEGPKLTFVASAEEAPSVPVEVIGGPTGELMVRLAPEDAPPSLRPVKIGVAVETPWPGRKFAVLRRFEHARLDRTLQLVDPPGEDRRPGLRVKLSSGEKSRAVWLQKDKAEKVTLAGVSYEISYGRQQVPLGFKLKLDRFHIERYPGGMKPRSFESHVTLEDPLARRSEQRVLSMNHPLKYGRYSLYQSSYRQGRGRTASFLSVSRDPGQGIVFAGYITMLAGMIVVLGIRVADRRTVEQMKNRGEHGGMAGPKPHATRVPISAFRPTRTAC